MESTDPDSTEVEEAEDGELGQYAPALLAAEHWNLLAARSLIWNDAQSRASVFLTVLSASTIALALLADATGFGAETRTVALVLLPVVFLLGLAAYVRLVDVNTDEFQLVMAMNRLRHGYLALEPGIGRYLTTGHHDDERGVFTTYMMGRPARRAVWVEYLINMPTIVATVDAALAAVIAVLGLQAVNAPRAAAVAGGVAAFLLVWVVLYVSQRRILQPLSRQTARFPTPPDQS